MGTNDTDGTASIAPAMTRVSSGTDADDASELPQCRITGTPVDTSTTTLTSSLRRCTFGTTPVPYRQLGVGVNRRFQQNEDMEARPDSNPDSATHDVRRDPTLGTVVHVVGHRQARPNQPTAVASDECPFCPGGLEAPDAYEVRWFANRWPAMPGDRCEVVLYSPLHDASMATLGTAAIAQVIDLWAERTVVLGARADVDYVLVFENRGASVGATIAHPHGQIYAYDHVPDRPARLFAGQWRPDTDPARFVVESDDWTVSVPYASEFPVALSIAPRRHTGDLPSLDATQRARLAEILVDTFGKLDALYGEPLPYMMWINQRPFDGTARDAWMSIDIVSPWRRAGLARYIAAAEVGAGEYFNPVAPEEIAARLRAIVVAQSE